MERYRSPLRRTLGATTRGDHNKSSLLTWAWQIFFLEWLALSCRLCRNGVHTIALFEGSNSLGMHVS